MGKSGVSRQPQRPMPSAWKRMDSSHSAADRANGSVWLAMPAAARLPAQSIRCAVVSSPLRGCGPCRTLCEKQVRRLLRSRKRRVSQTTPSATSAKDQHARISPAARHRPARRNPPGFRMRKLERPLYFSLRPRDAVPWRRAARRARLAQPRHTQPFCAAGGANTRSASAACRSTGGLAPARTGPRRAAGAQAVDAGLRRTA